MTDTTPTGAATAALSGGDPAPADTTQQTRTPAATPGSVQQRVDPGATPGGWQPPEWAKDWPKEDLGYLEKKAFSDPRKLYDAYRNAERELSDGRIALPKDWNDAEAVAKFYDKVGRPESPDKYVAPKDADSGMFKALAPELHGAGLNQKQVDALSGALKKYNDSQMAALTDSWIKDNDAAQARLEKEWGAKTPQEIEHNRRAMRAMGISVEEATAYMRNGAEKFLRLLNAAGHMVAEDNSGDITSDDTLGFGLTPNRAAAELAELRGNKDFMARVYGKDQAARQKYERLVKAASEGGMVRNTVRSNFRTARSDT